MFLRTVGFPGTGSPGAWVWVWVTRSMVFGLAACIIMGSAIMFSGIQQRSHTLVLEQRYKTGLTD